MKNTTISILLSILVISFSCTGTRIGTKQSGTHKPGFRLQAGINHGGIVENTELKKTNNVEVDAFTGATKMGFNGGAHVLLPLGKNTVESGLDYLSSQQTFTYNDPINNYQGKRGIATSQIMIPVTYNFGFNRKKQEEGLFQLKIGYILQRNFFNINDQSASLPSCQLKDWSHGFTFGFSTAPYLFENGSRVGLYLDIYRGTQIYEDFYNQDEFDMPGSSFIKSGLIYQFKK